MSSQIQFRRGSTAQTTTFTGALAEVTVDTDKKTLVIHDGATAGGHPLASLGANTFTGAQTFSGTNSFTGTVSGITKVMVELGNVDNTSDSNKPVSTAQATAIALKADVATTYTKVQTDAAVAAATPSFATLTGKPTTLAGYGITDASTGGASLTPTAIKTAAYTAVKDDLVRVNTTAGAFSVTLPASPVDGTIVGFLDAYGTCATNNLTILPSASTTVAFDATNVILDIAGAYITMIYTSANANWSISW